MADHAHLVPQALHAEPGWPFDVGSILLSLPEGSALNARKALSGSASLWQREMLTVELRSQEMLNEKCEFVRRNAVRWKAVKTAEDLPVALVERPHLTSKRSDAIGIRSIAPVVADFLNPA